MRWISTSACVLMTLLASAHARAADAATTWTDLWQTPDQQGQSLMSSGKPAEAASRFKDARQRAYAELEAGQYANAAKHLEPFKDADSQYNRGNALARSGDLKGALTAYDQALTSKPGDKDLQRNRDLVQQALKRQQQQANGQSGGQSQQGGQGKQGGQDQQGGQSQQGGQERQNGQGQQGDQSQQAGQNQQPGQNQQAGQNQQGGQNQQSAQNQPPGQQAQQSGGTPGQQPGAAQNQQQNTHPQSPGSQSPGQQSADQNTQNHNGANQTEQANPDRNGANQASQQQAQYQPHAGQPTQTGTSATNPQADREAQEAARRDVAQANASRPGAKPTGDNAQLSRQVGAQRGTVKAPPPPTEQSLALDQWLRRIPDDPGELLRRKFLVEHMQKQEGSQ